MKVGDLVERRVAAGVKQLLINEDKLFLTRIQLYGLTGSLLSTNTYENPQFTQSPVFGYRYYGSGNDPDYHQCIWGDPLNIEFRCVCVFV